MYIIIDSSNQIFGSIYIFQQIQGDGGRGHLQPPEKKIIINLCWPLYLLPLHFIRVSVIALAVFIVEICVYVFVDADLKGGTWSGLRHPPAPSHREGGGAGGCLKPDQVDVSESADVSEHFQLLYSYCMSCNV